MTDGDHLRPSMGTKASSSAVRHEQAASPTPTQTTDLGTPATPRMLNQAPAPSRDATTAVASTGRVERITHEKASATWTQATDIESPALHPERWLTLASSRMPQHPSTTTRNTWTGPIERAVLSDGRCSQGAIASNSGNPSTDPPWTRSMTSVMNRPLPRIQPEPARSVRPRAAPGQPLVRGGRHPRRP